MKKNLIWLISIFLVVPIASGFSGGYPVAYKQGQSELSTASLESAATVTVPTQTPASPNTDETNNPLNTEEDPLLVSTDSGLLMVNAATQTAERINHDKLDTWELDKGFSPDKKLYAYSTGFDEETLNPKLVVLDVENKVILLELELTGPITRPDAESTLGDPAYEAMGAMRYYNSLAWSPDGAKLAFVAARTGDNADVYIFDRTDNSVARLTDEPGHAADLHWSPSGRLLQYVSVKLFGTGAGFEMDSMWYYDFESKQVQLQEVLESSGENFLAWLDDRYFLINSKDRMCESYNLRIVDITRFDARVIADGCFTGIAYDAEKEFGMFSVTEFNTENCPCGEPMDAGLMIFGRSVPIITETDYKKFEELDVLNIGFIPQGNLFTLYGDEGLEYIYYGYSSLEILPEVKGLVPLPSPTGDYWAWASRYKTGLWITENNSNPVELSQNFSGVPKWSLDGLTLYFYEDDQLLMTSAPEFNVELLTEIPDEEILALIN